MSRINKRNGVICLVFAMKMELEPFLKRVEVEGRTRIHKAEYINARLNGCPLLLVKCGIGPTRAANAIRNTPIRPSVIFSVGTAGALTPELRAYDIIVSAETVGMEGDPAAESSRMELIDCVSQALESFGARYHVGKIATVDRAVFTEKARRGLNEKTGAHAVDMESHSLAVEAKKLGADFIAVRIISDDLGSPPLPDRPKRRITWRDPLKFGRNLPIVIRWALFLRTFRRCVRRLAPVQENVVHTWRSADG